MLNFLPVTLHQRLLAQGKEWLPHAVTYALALSPSQDDGVHISCYSDASHAHPPVVGDGARLPCCRTGKGE